MIYAIAGLTPVEIMARWALPFLPDRIVEVFPSQDFNIMTGTAGPIFGGTGGGIQFELQDKNFWDTADFVNDRDI